MRTVQNNDTVEVHYTGTLSDGQIFDSSKDREPLKFTMGMGQLIPGFEAGVLNMSINETKTINIPCAEAYGERQEEMFHEILKSQLPQEIQPEVGMPLVSQAPDGQEMHFIISEVKADTIVIDGNHPLAGKDLNFELTLVSIQD